MTTPNPGHVLVTGPISGTFVIAGKVVDVTPEVLVFDTLEEAQAVSRAIGEAHLESGFLPVHHTGLDADGVPTGTTSDTTGTTESTGA